MSEPGEGAPARRAAWRFVPLALFLLVVALFAGYLIAAQLFGYDREALPSALIGEPAPAMELAPLDAEHPGLTPALLAAPGVKVVNIWASWCVPCRAEHPQLMALAETGTPIYGINHRDKPEDARAFLSELGDPFDAIGVDPDGRAGVEWGVYGVPETFVIDGSGTIVHKHVGPILPADLKERLLPAIEAAGG